MAYLSIGAVRADAVFVSGLRCRDEFSTDQVRQAVSTAIRAFGCSGCAGRVAQEFGDHPETAVIRMRWARGVAREAFADPPPEPGPGADAGGRRLMEEGMIQAQAMAARIACARMTMLHLTELHKSVERACCLTARSQWDRKAAAHAELFRLLADVVDDPLLAPQLTGAAASAREMMLAVGHAADGMIVSSRRRLLAHLRAGDGEGAALEMEAHLRVLHYMWRLARPSSSAIAIEAAT
jgi:hypothetical protein